MEIKYPLFLVISFVLILLYLFYPSKKKEEKKKKEKIANTSFVKNTAYYKKIFKNYQIYKIILLISFGVAILSSILLSSRIQKTETHDLNEYKRDIILCMDVSTSVDQLNVEMIANLKKTVKSLKGERFGISMFNTTSVLVSPLTDDYEYILSSLEDIEKSIKMNIKITSGEYVYPEDNYYYIRDYIYTGTIEGNQARGSSLIGDGLASCVYSFPKLEEDRSRIIIFTTDNELAGEPIVTLDKAADISKNHNIKVFGIGTRFMQDGNYLEMKDAVEKTGGKFYQQSTQTVKSMVNDIEKTSKSLIDSKTETKQTDMPTIPFILLLLSFVSIIICSRKVIL
ncbi:MAG: VWA domain-containing protein [Bacilli bacterium]|nr:VWA domain-containing protein [Bacilli bacterium]